MKFRVAIQIEVFKALFYIYLCKNHPNPIWIHFNSGDGEGRFSVDCSSAIHALDNADAIHCATADRASSKIHQGRL